MIFVVGGSGGLSTNDALLHINTLKNSTITLKKGSVTVATLAANQGHANSDGATADWYYSVGSTNYGEWNITATVSGKTATKKVNINSNKQYDALLTFETYIVKGGYVQLPLKLTYGPYTIATHTEDYNSQGYLHTLITSNFSLQCGFCTEQTVNVNNYSSLKIDVAFDYNQSNSEGYTGGIGLASSNTSITSVGFPSTYTSKQAVYYLYPTLHGTNRRTCTVDISSLKGNFYITAYEGSGYQGTNIYNFWLA